MKLSCIVKYWEGFLAGLCLGLLTLLGFLISFHGFKETFINLENYFLAAVAVLTAFIGARSLYIEIRSREIENEEIRYRNSLVARSERTTKAFLALEKIDQQILWLAHASPENQPDINVVCTYIYDIVQTSKDESNTSPTEATLIISHIFQVLLARDKEKVKFFTSGLMGQKISQQVHEIDLARSVVNWLILKSCLNSLLLQSRTTKRELPKLEVDYSNEFLSTLYDDVWIESYRVNRAPTLTSQVKAILDISSDLDFIVPEWMLKFDANNHIFQKRRR